MKFRNNKTQLLRFVCVILVGGFVCQMSGSDGAHAPAAVSDKAAQKEKALELVTVAGISDDPARIRELVLQGAEVNTMYAGNLPLVMAAHRERSGNVLELLRLGADPEKREGFAARGNNFLHYVGGVGFESASNRDGENLRIYEQYCQESEFNPASREALNLLPFAQPLREIIVAYLTGYLCGVATIKLKNQLCRIRTPANHGLVRDLLAEKADPNSYQQLDVAYRMTPLQIALMRGDFITAQILLAHKADPKLEVGRNVDAAIPFMQLLIDREPFVNRPYISSLWSDCARQNRDGTFGEEFFLQGLDGMPVPAATDAEKKRMREIIDFMEKNWNSLSQVDQVFVRTFKREQAQNKA